MHRSHIRPWLGSVVSVGSIVATLAAGSPAGAAETIYGIVPGNVLIRFDGGTPGTVTSIPVTGLGPVESIRGIDFRPRTGQLYASTVTTGSAANSIIRTYVINPLTGAATFRGQTAAALAGAADIPTGYDFNPTVDRIRYVNTNDENARVNPNNGSLAGNDTDLTPGTVAIIAAAYDRNFDRGNAVAIPTTLYVIDRDLSQLAVQGGTDGGGPGGPNAGVITLVGSLGFVLNAVNDGGFDIVPGRGGQRAFAALTRAADNLTRLYTINLATGAATAVGLIGNGTTEVRSLAVEPHGILVVGADAGAPPVVRVFDAVTGAERFSFLAYPASFTGGVRVAVGDVSGDGEAEIITAPGPGYPPLVRIFQAGPTVGAVALGEFLAYDPSFTGGVFVATGDVNGDGFDEIVVGADVGGGPHVRVFDGRTGGALVGFFAFDAGFTGGVRVATGDFALQGRAQIVAAAGPGGGPHVRVFDADGSPFILAGFGNNFFAYDSGFAGGVYVAVGDVNGDGRPDIITGAGAGGGPHVKVFSGDGGALLASFFAYDAGFAGGVRVGISDVNADGRVEVLTGAGPGGGPHVRAFDALTLAELDGFFAFTPSFTSGVFVGGHR